MTPTIEGNKLIAEFMELYLIKGEKYPFGHPVTKVNFKEARYHYSWDWLMPVVEKISNIHYPDYWGGIKPDDANEWEDCAYPRTFGMRDSEGNYMVRFNANTLFSAATLIEATYNAVVEFIKDYNENN